MELTLEAEDRVVPRMSHSESDKVTLWRGELDSYYQRIKGFSSLDPDQIFRELAALSGRVSEIRSYLVRMSSRAAQTFRTQEVDFFLSEIDRQFRTYSRCHSVREMEFRLSGGGM